MEYTKPEHWHVCVEMNHPKSDAYVEHKAVVSFVPKEYWAAHNRIRPQSETTKAEFKMLDDHIERLHLWWCRKKDGVFGNRVNTIGNMQFEATVFGDGKNKHGILARHLVQRGFVYNSSITKCLPSNLQGTPVEPLEIDTADCAHGIASAVEADLTTVSSIVPAFAKEGIMDRVGTTEYWKQKKKSKTERTFEFTYHPQLRAIVATDDLRVLSVNFVYEGASDVDEAFYKAENESDQKYIDFVRENMNRAPTKKDFQVVACAVNLFLTLPPGHAATSVIKTLRGTAVATKFRTEFGIAKKYKSSRIEQMVWNLEHWLKDRAILKYKCPQQPVAGQEPAPEHISHRDTSPMEMVLLQENYYALSEKYSK